MSNIKKFWDQIDFIIQNEENILFYFFLYKGGGGGEGGGGGGKSGEALILSAWGLRKYLGERIPAPTYIYLRLRL